MVVFKVSSSKMNLVVLLLALLGAFGLWGCGDGGDNSHVTFGHSLQFTITDGVGAIAGLDGNITVVSSTGDVGAIEVNGTQITVEVTGMTANPTYITMIADLDNFVPLIRRFQATPLRVVDESGNEFTFVLLASGSMPAGGATGVSNEENHDPQTGTAADLTTPVVDAGDNFEAGVEVPSGAFFSNLDGSSVNGRVSMNFAYHQGTTDQEPYYPNGTYDGNQPAAFGTLSFLDGSGNFIMPATGTDMYLAFTFMQSGSRYSAGNTAAEESTYATVAPPTTVSACLTEIGIGTSATVSCNLGRSGEVICRVIAPVPEPSPVFYFRVDEGVCVETGPVPNSN